jgi:NAD(P)-dependent dehydrogenase (short-subunit alcohol dehydrogenase family)
LNERGSSAPIARVALAVVTGGGTGIGRAIALEFARRGVAVALVGRTEATLRETAIEATRTGARAIVARGDVTLDPDVRRITSEILAAAGVPQVVVNNAGIAGRLAPIEQTSETEWDAVMNVNLKGVFLVTRAMLPPMRAARRGRFVTMASISATIGTPGLAAYGSSKWGAVGFTKALAEELRDSGLQAMAVLPGTVATPMATIGGFAPKMSVEDVARVVAFASLDAPDAMNGASIECFG